MHGVGRSEPSPKLLAQAAIGFCGVLQAPPKKEQVPVDGVQAVRVSDRTTLLRGVCNQRFKFEVEYGLKRGTTDNCYVTRVRFLALSQPALHSALVVCWLPLCALLLLRAEPCHLQGDKDRLLIDVPDEAWLEDFGGPSRCTMQASCVPRCCNAPRLQ